MHRLTFGRPNVIPPLLTTGIGPGGSQTLYTQPIADSHYSLNSGTPQNTSATSSQVDIQQQTSSPSASLTLQALLEEWNTHYLSNAALPVSPPMPMHPSQESLVSSHNSDSQPSSLRSAPPDIPALPSLNQKGKGRAKQQHPRPSGFLQQNLALQMRKGQQSTFRESLAGQLEYVPFFTLPHCILILLQSIRTHEA